MQNGTAKINTAMPAHHPIPVSAGVWSLDHSGRRSALVAQPGIGHHVLNPPLRGQAKRSASLTARNAPSTWPLSADAVQCSPLYPIPAVACDSSRNETSFRAQEAAHSEHQLSESVPIAYIRLVVWRKNRHCSSRSGFQQRPREEPGPVVFKIKNSS